MEHSKRKLAIIGASYLQVPLIEKAKAMNLETHVFAWLTGDPGEKLADYFYPISIVEKEAILEQCQKIGIHGICSIASDLATITVNYVAEKMGLIGNSLVCSHIATNKHAMRNAFEENGDPSPKSYLVSSSEDLAGKPLLYPVIVKPLDRSGSRGITKLESPEGLDAAIDRAKSQGFLKCALVEEFATGIEYSVECISWEGHHTFLAMTRKYTTGSPHFIETGHIQPAPVDSCLLEKVKEIVFHALNSLQVRYGASHSEVKIREDGTVMIIEIGARMGGDLIGSDLVKLSTGVDFVKAVIDIALGCAPAIPRGKQRAAGVRFVFGEPDIQVLKKLQAENPQFLVRAVLEDTHEGIVEDSSMRFGYYLFSSERIEDLIPYMPAH